MTAAPNWLQTGVEEQIAKLDTLYATMLQAPPSPEQKELFLRSLDLLHELRTLATRLAPVHRDLTTVHRTAGTLSPSAAELKAISPQPASHSEPGVYTGTFVRMPRGGCLVADGGQQIPMTEGRYQQMHDQYNLQHGDLVEARVVGAYLNTRTPKYFFSVLEHRGGPNADRVEAFGAMEWRRLTPIVRGHDLEIVLERKDIEYHDVDEGDVIHLAYLKSEVKQGEVPGYILRKLTEEEIRPPEDGVRRPAVRSRAKQGENPAPSAPEACFVGEPSILILGGRNWPYFRDGLKLHGAGELEHLEGFDTHRNLESQLLAHTLVIVLKDFCSHENSNKAREVVPKERLYITTLENWSGFRDQLLVPKIIPAWNGDLITAAD